MGRGESASKVITVGATAGDNTREIFESDGGGGVLTKEIDGGESTSPVGASIGGGTRKIFLSDGVVLGDCHHSHLLPPLHAVIKERECPSVTLVVAYFHQ